tara:strand:+ start:547 stop:687 length:141 start_codon:yes stop_codon:yes gene_type:complete
VPSPIFQKLTSLSLKSSDDIIDLVSKTQDGFLIIFEAAFQFIDLKK